MKFLQKLKRKENRKKKKEKKNQNQNQNFQSNFNTSILKSINRQFILFQDRGANVEPYEPYEPCELALQLAAASGSVKMVELLLSCGASAFRSTTESHHGFSSASHQGGCYSAVAVAATHGHKKVLNLIFFFQFYKNFLKTFCNFWKMIKYQANLRQKVDWPRSVVLI